jgi:hypothetical protein
MSGSVSGRVWVRRTVACALAVALPLLWSSPADARKRRAIKMESEVEETSEETTEEVAEKPARKRAKKEKPKAEEGGDEGESSEEGKADGSEDETKVSKRATDADDAPSDVPLPNALEFGVGGMAMFRHLVWTSDGAAAGLGPYSLAPGPQAGLWLEFYPAAFATRGFASNIGLFARYDYGFGVSSYTVAGGDVATKYQGFLGGLKLRIPLGTFTPYGTLGYGNQGFRLAPENSPADLPSVAYSFIRAGLGTRIHLSRLVALDVAGNFLAVTDPGSAPGQVASPAFFPRAKAVGFEFGASVYVHLTSAIGARAGIDWRQYGMAFYPQAGDSPTRMVTGAVDRYIVVWSGIEVALGGGEPEAPDDDAPPKSKRRGKKPAAADEEEE